MLKRFLKLFRKPQKQIVFIDGDQGIPGIIAAYHKYVKGTGIETHMVRQIPSGQNPPKIFQDLGEMNKVFLNGYTQGKEITDKFIGASIQKAVTDGYTHITVISSDYDFIDIFKMAVMIDPNAQNVTFRMIIPNPSGRLKDLGDRIANIEIIKE
jgi:hypothetical protein